MVVIPADKYPISVTGTKIILLGILVAIAGIGFDAEAYVGAGLLVGLVGLFFED